MHNPELLALITPQMDAELAATQSRRNVIDEVKTAIKRLLATQGTPSVVRENLPAKAPSRRNEMIDCLCHKILGASCYYGIYCLQRNIPP